MTGIYTAWLVNRMGIDTVCIFESTSKRVIREGYPAAFPSGGTFYPRYFETLSDESGFPIPEWERIPVLKFHISGQEIVLNSDDGPGGFQLVLTDIFRDGKDKWLPWIQDQIGKSVELLSDSDVKAILEFQPVETSVADWIEGLGLKDPEIFTNFFDALSTITCGLGIAQIEISDFPYVLAGILNGWHTPVTRYSNWFDSTGKILTESGVLLIEDDVILDIETGGNRRSILKLQEGRELSAPVLVVPENDLYRHPAIVGEPDPIAWENWYGRAATHLELVKAVGLIRTSGNRPPVNDNFITWHIDPEKGGIFTLSAPVEGRYIHGNGGKRFETITRLVVPNVTKPLGWVFPDLAISPGSLEGKKINLSGTALSITYLEGPMWGDDIYTQFLSADRLSRDIQELLK